jgi:competence protein ComEA
MKSGWAAAWWIAFGVLLALVAAGVLLLLNSRPRGEPIRLLPLPSSQPLVVQVGGEVANPGVYSLPPGSRVEDAIRAASGALPGANLELVNQAALIQDGELIWIPPVQPTPIPERFSSTLPPLNTPEVAVTPEFPINLNTATLEELEALPHIGQVLAQRIIEYRLANGPFQQVEDVQMVDGIGPGIYAEIQDLITVENIPSGVATP